MITLDKMTASSCVYNWEDEIAVSLSSASACLPSNPLTLPACFAPNCSHPPSLSLTSPRRSGSTRLRPPLCRKAVQDHVVCILSQTTKIKHRKVALTFLFLGPPNWLMMFPPFFFSLRYQGKSSHDRRTEFGYDIVEFTSVAVALEQTFLITIIQADICDSMVTPFEICNLLCIVQINICAH